VSIIRWTEALLAFSLQATLVIAVTALASRRLQANRERDRLWNLCFLALLTIPVAGLALPHLRLINTSPVLRLAEHPHESSAAATFALGIAVVWGAGTVLLIGRLTFDALILGVLLRGSVPLPAEIERGLHALMTDSGRDGGTSLDPWSVDGKPLRILVSTRLVTACCCQLQTPTILLPSHLLALRVDELAYVIRHELSHLRCGHPLKLFLQRCTECIFWFHPALWWASRHACLVREYVCDEASVVSRADAARYLRVLLQLMIAPSVQIPRGTLGFGNSRSLLVERAASLARLERRREAPPRPRHAWIALVGGLSMAVILTLWIPIGDSLSFRSVWSPWPAVTAECLHAAGIPARDYEVDGHRFRLQERTIDNSRVLPGDEYPE
jgi:hypothetical protein